MEIIDERCLKLDLYEYLTNWREKGTRAVMVITDKQCIFYTQILPEDFKTHDAISIDIENEIHPTNQKYGWDAIRDNHIYLFFDKIGVGIAMPGNEQLSYAQAQFITEYLEVIDKYNKEHEEKRVKLDFHASGNYDGLYDTFDIDSIIDRLEKQITNDITIEEEKIIGNTLSEEDKRKNLKKQLGCESCHSIKDIIKVLGKTDMFYNNSYYKDILSTIFPDYEKLKGLAPLLENLDNNDQSIDNVNLDNIKNIIVTYLKNAMNKSKNYSSLSKVTMAMEKIHQDTEILPHFELFSKLVKELSPENEKEEEVIEKILNSSSNYEELIEQIAYLSQKRKKHELEESRKLLKEETERLEQINRQNKLVIYRNQLSKIVDEREMTKREKEDTSKKIVEQEKLLKREEEKKKQEQEQIEKLSKSFLKRIIHRRKIKHHRQELLKSTHQSEILRTKKEGNCRRVKELQNKINSLEESFKSIADMDIPMDKSIILRLCSYQASRANILNSRTTINNLKEGIKKLEEEKNEIETSGIIKKGIGQKQELQEMVYALPLNTVSSNLKDVRLSTPSVSK